MHTQPLSRDDRPRAEIAKDGLETVRVIVVAHQPISRAALRLVLDRSEKIVVVGEASSCAEGMSFSSRSPDVALLYVPSLLAKEPEGLTELRRACGAARLILLVDHESDEASRHAVRLGALGLVGKGESADTLAKAIIKVAQGEAWFNRSAMATIIESLFRDGPRQEGEPEGEQLALLTKREREVVRMAAQGLRNKQIADQLCISEVTVRHYLTSIFSKLGVSDRMELMLFSMRHGLDR